MPSAYAGGDTEAPLPAGHQAGRERAPLVANLLEAIYRRIFWLIARAGLPPSFIVELEVPGRRSSKMRSTVLILAERGGQRFAVSVLGEKSDWVKNARTAGEGIVRHGKRIRVRLEELPEPDRPPVLKAYLKWAFGARRIFEVQQSAPVTEFGRIAHKHPVFRLVKVE